MSQAPPLVSLHQPGARTGFAESETGNTAASASNIMLVKWREEASNKKEEHVSMVTGPRAAIKGNSAVKERCGESGGPKVGGEK